ncbi:MAG: response regulator [Comamonadaceae bacterium]|nr:MAG: response regulator [Comamonadaceae bacterium]
MENRILILAPRGRDAQVIATVLEAEKIACLVCRDAPALLAELAQGAAAAIVTEETLPGELADALGEYLARQPAWSDFPFVVLAMRQSGRRSPPAVASLQGLGNLLLVERPVNPETLVSAARSAQRARKRQYATRLHLEDIEAAKRTVEQFNAELEDRIAARTADLASANDRLTREIAERERVQASVVQGQKLEAIGRLTGGIAHDFNNLLHAINLNLQFIARLAGDGKLADYARRAKASVDRGARLTAQLLSFARARTLLPRLHDVNAVVTNVRELIEVSVGSKVELDIALCEGEAPVMLDAAQLEMALLNLAVNSRDAMANGGRLSIRTERIANGAGQVKVIVQDSGSGISEAVLPRVFDPFFTTKGNGEGTGLGLSQVYGFARQSGGSADILSTPQHGTTVTLQFPLAATEEHRQSTTPALPGAPTERPGLQRAEVLVVEDDDEVRHGIAEGLRLLQYSVREARNGEQGLQELRHSKPDLLMVDYLMPGMTGAEVVAAARALYPQIPVLVATGYADMAEVEKVVGAQSVLKKPFDLEALSAAVGNELARARMPSKMGA